MASKGRAPEIDNSKKPYWRLGQGHGGVYKFPLQYESSSGAIQDVYAIGTVGCRTCVGVFVPLSEDTCFVAHISAFLKIGEDADTGQSVSNHLESGPAAAEPDQGDEGRSLMQESDPDASLDSVPLQERSMNDHEAQPSAMRNVQSRIRQEIRQEVDRLARKDHHKRSVPNADQVMALKELIKKRVQALCPNSSQLEPQYKEQAVMICPYHTTRDEKATGWYIMEALCETFGLESVERYHKPGHGILIDWQKSEKVETLGWEDHKREKPNHVFLTWEDFDAHNMDFAHCWREWGPLRYGSVNTRSWNVGEDKFGFDWYEDWASHHEAAYEW